MRMVLLLDVARMPVVGICLLATVVVGAVAVILVAAPPTAAVAAAAVPLALLSLMLVLVLGSSSLLSWLLFISSMVLNLLAIVLHRTKATPVVFRPASPGCCTHSVFFEEHLVSLVLSVSRELSIVLVSLPSILCAPLHFAFVCAFALAFAFAVAFAAAVAPTRIILAFEIRTSIARR